jgi:ribosomal protein S9
MVRAGATRILHGLFGLRPWGNKTKPNQNKPKVRQKKFLHSADARRFESKKFTASSSRKKRKKNSP